MYKKIDSIIVYLTFIILILSAYFTITNTWLAKEINLWQMRLLGEPKIYPILSIFCLFILPMMILLPLKFFIKNKIEK